jgi:hypothetical protein
MRPRASGHATHRRPARGIGRRHRDHHLVRADLGGEHVGHQASGPQSNTLSRLNCALRAPAVADWPGPKGPGPIIRAELSGPNCPGRIIRAERPEPNYPGRIIRAERTGGRIIRAERQEEFLVLPGHYSSTERTSKHGEW